TTSVSISSGARSSPLQGEDLAPLDIETDVVKGPKTGPVGFAELADGYDGLHLTSLIPGGGARHGRREGRHSTPGAGYPARSPVGCGTKKGPDDPGPGRC